MAKNDNAHAVRLVNSLRQYTGHDAAEAFGENYPLSKRASIEKKFEWARSACVKRVPGELSKTWCCCTLGNAEGIFREVFKKDVKAALLGSIKTGSDRCTIKIEW